MRGVVLAAAVGRLRAPGPMKSVDLVLDPSEEEHERIEGGGCFAFLFGGPAAFGPESETGSDGAERGKEQDDVPAAALVWSNYGTWQAASGADTVPSSKEELLEARKLALIGARAVWRALKESVPTMDGPRIQPKYSLPQPTPRRAAAVAIPPTAVGDGEMDDEIEEVEDDDARMEI
jgi:exosome complex component RRP46